MIGVGSFVNFAGTYSIGSVVASVVAPGPDPYWLVVLWSGEQSIQIQAPESQLWEIAFLPFPAGWAPGDVAHVQDDGRFWFQVAGAGVPIGRALVVYSVSVTNGGFSLPVAWLQLEGGRPAIIAFWESLTMVRKFGAAIP